MWAGAGRGGAVNQAGRMKLFPQLCWGQPLSCSCWGGCFPGWGRVSGCYLNLPTWGRLNISYTAFAVGAHCAVIHTNQRFCMRRGKKHHWISRIFLQLGKKESLNFKAAAGRFLNWPPIKSLGLFHRCKPQKLLPFKTCDLWKISWLDLQPHKRSGDRGAAVECSLLTPFHFLIWKLPNV